MLTTACMRVKSASLFILLCSVLAATSILSIMRASHLAVVGAMTLCGVVVAVVGGLTKIGSP